MELIAKKDIPKGYTKYTQDTINKYGFIPITKIEIRRIPIPSAINKLVNVLEAGGKLWNLSYDTYYHLFMVLTLETGHEIMAEKNETINIQSAPDTRNIPDEAKIQVPLPSYGLWLKTGGTLTRMLDAAQRYMGNDKFFWYHPLKSNCQDWIMGMLKGNRLGNEEIYKFVKQDLTSIIKNTPKLLDWLMVSLTDFASYLRTKKEELGLKRGGIVTTHKDFFKTKRFSFIN